jgi:hypothetical protein
VASKFKTKFKGDLVAKASNGASPGVFNWGLKATSHTRLGARDHYTSSTLSLVEKAGPVQIRFTLHLMEYVNARWM